MKLRSIVENRWRLFAVVGGRSECQVLGFLDDLERADHRESLRTMAFLDRVALLGPPRDTTRSRVLKGAKTQGRGGERVLELKTRGGVRIVYFYDSGGRVICCEALHKPKSAQLGAARDRAKHVREQYFRDKAEGRIEVIGE